MAHKEKQIIEGVCDFTKKLQLIFFINSSKISSKRVRAHTANKYSLFKDFD